MSRVGYHAAMQFDGTPGQPTPIDAALLMMRFLYAALLISVGVYLVVVHFIVRSESSGQLSATDPLYLGLAGAAGVVGLAAPFVRRVLMPPRQAASTLNAPKPTHLSPKGFGRSFAAYIVGWAMCEMVTVLGVVMAFLAGSASVFYPFAGGAVLMFVFLAPRRSELEEVARAEAPDPDGG